MRYILAFLLLTFIVAAFLFQSKSTSYSQDESVLKDDFEIENKNEQREHLINKVEVNKAKNSPPKAQQKLTHIQQVKTVPNMKVEKNQRLVKRDSKKRYSRKKVKYTVREDEQNLISGQMGEYYIQEHLQVISAQSYSESQGKVLAQSAGYYFIKTPDGKKTTSFPIVVKNKNKTTLKLMTGVISLKSSSQSDVEDVARQYSLSKVQFFRNINLYIFKISTPQNIVSVFKKIQQAPGIDEATLEILNKKVSKL